PMMRMTARSPATTGCVVMAIMTAAADKMLRMRYLFVVQSDRFSEARINLMWLDKNPDNPDGFSDERVATLSFMMSMDTIYKSRVGEWG
ncbi:MAG: hypothetical protein VXW94_07440, partial [Pseudomonadota bacterium]|nr:hypothetical protein [Pseudomonadota bacterium]